MGWASQNRALLAALVIGGSIAAITPFDLAFDAVTLGNSFLRAIMLVTLGVAGWLAASKVGLRVESHGARPILIGLAAALLVALYVAARWFYFSRDASATICPVSSTAAIEALALLHAAGIQRKYPIPPFRLFIFCTCAQKAAAHIASHNHRRDVPQSIRQHLDQCRRYRTAQHNGPDLRCDPLRSAWNGLELALPTVWTYDSGDRGRRLPWFLAADVQRHFLIFGSHRRGITDLSAIV